MKKFWCENCRRYVNTEIVRKTDVWPVMDDEIEYESDVRVCSGCGEYIFDEVLDSKTFNHVFDLYRKKHNILPASDIKKIRLKYGITQREFARLLDWRFETVQQYEDGIIPKKEHYQKLLEISDPSQMEAISQSKPNVLSPSHARKLETRLHKLKTEDPENIPEAENPDKFFDPSENLCFENGWQTFDYEKFEAAVSWFVQRFQEINKAKLLKLLNYSDFTFYKEYSTSLTGSKYVHYPYGPVPLNYDTLLGQMEKDGIIRQKTVIRPESGKSESMIVSGSENDLYDILDPKEKKVLGKVAEAFKDFSADQVSDWSHKETGYLETKPDELISYTYARKLNPLPGTETHS